MIKKKKKKIKANIKLVLTGGKATPTPPIGPALGQHGINIMNFCKDYNNQTSMFIGVIIPVNITIYEDKTYTLILKSSPTSNLLKKALNVLKGSAIPNKTFIGTITFDQLFEIANFKLKDLNTKNIQKAISIIQGTAKSLGIKIL
uniref:Large ribosomal subunit protein uL11m n=1 Tax=Spumella sp. NIES-1846 TaxID=2490549 RepID=A0A455RI04_9STRA|nr:ribosomal protein L11 [Spumella sp. NIES-1846]